MLHSDGFCGVPQLSLHSDAHCAARLIASVALLIMRLWCSTPTEGLPIPAPFPRTPRLAPGSKEITEGLTLMSAGVKGVGGCTTVTAWAVKRRGEGGEDLSGGRDRVMIPPLPYLIKSASDTQRLFCLFFCLEGAEAG